MRDGFFSSAGITTTLEPLLKLKFSKLRDVQICEITLQNLLWAFVIVDIQREYSRNLFGCHLARGANVTAVIFGKVSLWAAF